MPTYGYECTQCQHHFSVRQAMKDDPIAVCPECEGKVKRLLYPVGIVFKGSGWYVNDSRKPEKTGESGDKVKADGDGAETPKTDGDKPKTAETPSGDAKTESKPVPTAPIGEKKPSPASAG